MPTNEELQAQLEELRALIVPPLPEIEPNWGERTCQVCGAPADVIDTDETLRRTSLVNGEGYCLKHAKEALILTDGRDHLVRRGVKA